MHESVFWGWFRHFGLICHTTFSILGLLANSALAADVSALPVKFQVDSSLVWQISSDVYRVKKGEYSFDVYLSDAEGRDFAKISHGADKTHGYVTRVEFLTLGFSVLFPITHFKQNNTAILEDTGPSAFLRSGASYYELPFGRHRTLLPNVHLSALGFLSINGNFVSHYGAVWAFEHSAASAHPRLTIAYPSLPNHSVTEASTELLALNALADNIEQLKKAGTPFPTFTDLETNYPVSPELLTNPSQQSSLTDYSCTIVPDCCCDPPVGGRRDSRSNCLGKVELHGQGGFGFVTGPQSLQSPLHRFPNNPCTANTKEFLYKWYKSIKENALDAVRTIEKFRAACDVPGITVRSASSAGIIFGIAAQSTKNVDFHFYSVPFGGFSGLMGNGAAVLSLVIPASSGSGSDIEFRDATLGSGSTGTINFNPNDNLVGEFEQRNGFIKSIPPNTHVRHDSPHTSSMDHLKPPTCCGDGKTNGVEMCDFEESRECSGRFMPGPNLPMRVYTGICSFTCVCKIKDWWDPYAIPEDKGPFGTWTSADPDGLS